MKKHRKVAAVLLAIATGSNILIAGAWVAHAATPVSTTPTSVSAAIDAGKTFTPINPNLCGMFIEHAGGLVYKRQHLRAPNQITSCD